MHAACSRNFLKGYPRQVKGRDHRPRGPNAVHTRLPDLWLCISHKATVHRNCARPGGQQIVQASRVRTRLTACNFCRADSNVCSHNGVGHTLAHPHAALRDPDLSTAPRPDPREIEDLRPRNTIRYLDRISAPSFMHLTSPRRAE